MQQGFGIGATSSVLHPGLRHCSVTGGNAANGPVCGVERMSPNTKINKPKVTG